MSSEKAKFGTKMGLIAATVGSAVGLGNVWRFPAVAQQNGGAAFLLIYIGCVFLLGIPVMMSEFAIGRGGHSNAIGSFRKLAPGSLWWVTGLLGILASYLILSYYMVVSGWTMEYFVHSVTGFLYDGHTPAGDNAVYVDKMNTLIRGDVQPVVWTFIMLILNLVILLKGVNKGIERMSNILMPVLFVLLLAFCIFALHMPKAADGLEFFLKPDFSKVTGSTFIAALGQAFYSLSLGMGILLTFAAYYPQDTKLTRTATTVASLDFLVAFLMGIIIFPAVKSFGLDADPEALQGTTLVFVTLPEVFNQMTLPHLWSALFFLLLGIAALTSTISLAEVSISLVQDRLKLTRMKSVLVVVLPLFVLSSINSLSLGRWSDITIFGKTIFDALDYVTSNVMLPLCALFACLFVGWRMKGDFLRRQMTNYDSMTSPMYPIIRATIRYVAPVLILTIMLSSLLK